MAESMADVKRKFRYPNKGRDADELRNLESIEQHRKTGKGSRHYGYPEYVTKPGGVPPHVEGLDEKPKGDPPLLKDYDMHPWRKSTRR